MLQFFVAGLPVTQGSMRPFVVAGKARMRPNSPGGLQGWRHSISDEARKAFMGDALLTGPVWVSASFRLLKPKSAPKKTRTYPIGGRSGDLDKLARAVLDALTGVIWGDDSQVIQLNVTKDYDNPPGVLIKIACDPKEIS